MKKFLSIAVLSFLLLSTSCFAKDRGCDINYISALFERFDYWMTKYDHHGADHSTSFSRFPEADGTLATFGAEYEDYLCLRDVAIARGYNIKYVIKQSGYYQMLRYSQRNITE